MEPLSEGQRIGALERDTEKLETKVDNGFAETRAEFRALRAEIGGVHRNIQAMWLTMILGFAGIILGLVGVLVQQHL